jgi:Ig-like domain CHU_C associated/Dual-action HEIGH metallo-peptidase
VIRSFRFVLPLLVVLFASALSAVTYVVPTDRFELERSSAVIVGRVLRSQAGSETITEVAVEEAIKGDPGFLVQIHVPREILGAPSFTDGERVLLFLYHRADGAFVVNDLQLGAFHFVDGLFLRDESELTGWDPDGKVHEERPRSAERFLDYVRGVMRGETVKDDYFVAPHAAAGSVKLEAAYTATSYTLQYNGGVGSRWNVFPGAVNWNQGNSETGALGSGTPQINAAFNTWNAGGAHYVLASATPNTKGFLEAADGVNNIVFEKDLTSFGLQPFSCTNGGALGLGGMKKAGFGASAHVFHGETFATTIEADVSMNQGIANCTTAQLAPGEFATVITHELGHTLGFRHSDQNRLVNAACSTDPTLECDSHALMNHILVSGLNGHLQTWDKTALEAVYGSGPACLPPSITQQPSGSTIAGGATAQLSVNAAGTGPLSYQWYVGASGNTSSPVSGGSTATVSVSPPVSTAYWVRVTGQCAPSADSNSALVTVNAVNCPAVIPGTPHATAINGGFQLSVSAGGGSSFTYRWFEGSTQVGTGNPLFVNPAQPASYWCRITNQCGNSADSALVTVGACVTPQIVEQPKNQQVSAGTTVMLVIAVNDASAAITWFQGVSGDTTAPVGIGPSIVSPVLTRTTQFWARVTGACGSVDSEAATITVNVARRRSIGR